MNIGALGSAWGRDNTHRMDVTVQTRALAALNRLCSAASMMRGLGELLVECLDVIIHALHMLTTDGLAVLRSAITKDTSQPVVKCAIEAMQRACDSAHDRHRFLALPESLSSE